MRTLHLGLRVADLEASLAFYRKLGYELVGTVPDSPIGSLAMLKLPGDEFVTLELVAGRGDPEAGGTLSHFVIHVESMQAALAELDAEELGIEGPTSPDGSEDFLTAWLTDPDGNRIELVQWPPGHPDGMTEADWAHD
jgi:lactoylglutathione lyase